MSESQQEYFLTFLDRGVEVTREDSTDPDDVTVLTFIETATPRIESGPEPPPEMLVITPAGIPGLPGPPGPIGTEPDLLDLTLLFENGLT